MYGSTERVNRLRERLMETIPRVDAERAVLVTKAYQETEGQPMVIRRARALEKILSEMTVFILEDELVVGNKAKTYRGTSLYPEYSSLDWFYEELDSGEFEKRTVYQERFLISEEDKEALRSIRDYRKDTKISATIWLTAYPTPRRLRERYHPGYSPSGGRTSLYGPWGIFSPIIRNFWKRVF